MHFTLVALLLRACVLGRAQKLVGMKPDVIATGNVEADVNTPFYMKRFEACLDLFYKYFLSFDLGAPRDSVSRKMFEGKVRGWHKSLVARTSPPVAAAIPWRCAISWCKDNARCQCAVAHRNPSP